MKEIRVRDVMFREPFTLRSMHPAAEAATLMKDIDCGILPVVDNDAPIGVITDRDITLRVVAEGHDPQKTPVKNVMTRAVYACVEETSLEEAAALMRRFGVARLCVLRGRRLVGVVTLKHLLQNAGDMWTAGKIIQALQAEPPIMMPVKTADQSLSILS